MSPPAPYTIAFLFSSNRVILLLLPFVATCVGAFVSWSEQAAGSRHRRQHKPALKYYIKQAHQLDNAPSQPISFGAPCPPHTPDADPHPPHARERSAGQLQP